MSFGMLALIDKVNNRTRALERQLNPASARPIATSVVDNIEAGVDFRMFNQVAAPAGLNESSDVGTEWINSATGAFQWWDGIAWHAGEFPFQNNGGVEMLTCIALAAGRTSLKVTSSTSAPGSPNTGDYWVNTTSGIVYNVRTSFSAWQVITDTQTVGQIGAAALRGAGFPFTIWMQNTAPGSPSHGDYWVDTDSDNFDIYMFSVSSWNYLPNVNDSEADLQVYTGAKFQTATFGQRMELSADVAGGVIKFWTNSSIETGPGWINPKLITGVTPIVEFASPEAGAGSRSFIRLEPGEIEYDATEHSFISGDVLVNTNIQVTSQIHAGGGITGAKLFAISPDSQTGSATLRFNGAGQVVTATSLSKLKQSAKVLTLKDVQGLRKVTPRTWIDKADAKIVGKENAKKLHRHGGFFAEDVKEHAPYAAVHDLEGNLINVDHDGVVAGLTLLLQDALARIEALEAR